jgi:hypothetical protein
MSPTTPPTPAPKVGLTKWLSGHKWEAGLGASGIVVTVYLAYRSRKNASASSAGSSTSSTGASSALPVSYYPATSGGSGEGGGGGNFGNEILPILQNLQSELTTAGQSSASPSADEYVALPNASDLQALTSSGVQVYYTPAPGTDVYEPAGNQPGNTSDPELAWIQQNLPGGSGLYVKSTS